MAVVRDYQKLVGGKNGFSYYALEGYLMARVMVEGIKRAGRDLTREKLISSLETLNNNDFGGYRVSYGNNNRSGSRFVELTVVGPAGKLLK